MSPNSFVITHIRDENVGNIILFLEQSSSFHNNNNNNSNSNNNNNNTVQLVRAATPRNFHIFSLEMKPVCQIN